VGGLKQTTADFYSLDLNDDGRVLWLGLRMKNELK
jgi:hypothetical protein